MDHAERLAAASSENRANYQWTWVPDGDEAVRQYITAALEQAAVPFATTDRETGRVVGSTRFANFEYLTWPDGHEFSRLDGGPHGVEIGWTWLAGSAQRTPINTEAKWLMLRHAFETWGVRVVRLKTDRRNERSRAAIERIGAKFEGVVRAERVGVDATLRDSACYSIVQEEWPEVDRALRARLGRE